jgi:signal transduction histidine kinase
MRFLPNIGYGTEGYPEMVARRLRAVNLSAWILMGSCAGFAVAQLLDRAPGAAAVNALVAVLCASAPLLHRFGPYAAALALLFLAYADLSFFIWLLGTGSGQSKIYLVVAALSLLYFGAERIAVSALFGALAVVLSIVLELLVPYNTGVESPARLFAGFAVGTIVTCAALLSIVTYALREAARSEENLAREKEQVEDKTRQLEVANTYKSHFLASASHDLRQPLHALNLFVVQLQSESNPAERSRLVGRIDAAVGSMNELFEALLDMTKLEAGILKANPAEFPVGRLLERVETTFADAARKKGLNLRVVASDAWVVSDPILLERIVLNLVSNGALHGEGRRGGRMPPPQRSATHRCVRHRRRHSRGAAPAHLRRGLPALGCQCGSTGRVRPRSRHR